MEKAPKFDPNKPYTVVETGVGTGEQTDISSPSFMADALGKTAEAMDVPASIARAGVYGAVDEDSTMFGEMDEQLQRLKGGFGSVKEGPTGSDIMEAAGVESKAGKAVGGFLTEIATDPLALTPAGISIFTKLAKPIEKTIRKRATTPVARVLAEYTSLSKFGGEGVDPRLLSKRLRGCYK